MVWKNKYLLVSTIRIISLIIISIHFFSLFIFLFIYCFFFLTECQATCFKNSSYVFSKSGRIWSYNWGTCLNQGGYLVSIETEEEWRFITHEIQKRGTWNTSAWHIGLVRKDGVWIWQTGQQLNISKWRDSKQDGKKNRAEISKNEGLFNSISGSDENAFICEIPGGKITFPPLSLLVWVITCFRVQFGINKHE